MSGSSSLESSMVSSVLRLIPMDQYPPSSCLTFGLDEGYVIRGDSIGGPLLRAVGYRVGRMTTSPPFFRINLFSGLAPRRWLDMHKQRLARFKSCICRKNGNSHRWHGSKEVDS